MTLVKIKISFYDTDQRDLIEKHFPQDFALLEPLEDGFIKVPLEDFQTYSFFKHQTDADGYRTFLDLSKVSHNWSEYFLYFKYDPSTENLTNIYPGRIDGTNIPETLGIAGGLSVASSIHGLTQADWHNIGIKKHKDFDFRRLACINDRYINVEAKGTINEDNAKKSPAVSNHKKLILGKKSDPKFSTKYDYTQDSCLGIITVADRKNSLQSWIVDPIFDVQNIQPRKLKLIKRLNFYYSILRLISKRSYITIVLANRIKILEQVTDFESLSKIPLMNSNFDKLSLSSSFINSRASNGDKSVIGKSIIIKKNELFFIGIHINFINTIISQNTEEILELSNKSNTSIQVINCRIKNTRDLEDVLRRNNISSESTKNDDSYLNFSVNMTLIANSAGLYVARLLLK